MTQSGLYLLPFAVAMVIVAPMTGRLSVAVGSKMVLVAGSLFAASSYLLLVLNHSQQWAMYVSAGLLGIGVALGFASMANLIIEAVPAEQTGVATGMNTNVRSIGAAWAAGSRRASSSAPCCPTATPPSGATSWPSRSAAPGWSWPLAALLIPRRQAPSIVVREPHRVLTAEAEVIVGAIAFGPEDLA